MKKILFVLVFILGGFIVAGAQPPHPHLPPHHRVIHHRHHHWHHRPHRRPHHPRRHMYTYMVPVDNINAAFNI